MLNYSQREVYRSVLLKLLVAKIFAQVDDPDVPATRAVQYHPGSYSVDPSYQSQNIHFSPDDGYDLEFKYHDYNQLTKFLRTTSSRYPNLTALYSIGKSVQGNSFIDFMLYLIHISKLTLI